ncbi:hypothetical protein [Corynebacterium sp.]|uniref:LGFP repeat-containing protein n=1 Tax=Corynebacterium sp. TaxID=1720 RepID=UPI0028A9BF8B|nr:hypothetical protein [Corynebacterium sp.]
MRCVQIPRRSQGGFTKEQADRAEIQEAEEQSAAGGIGIQATPTNCRTYWPSPFKVCGKIREKYDAIGGPTSFLTWPRSDEMGVPDGQGRRNEFVNGFIYWHPSTGAHPITTHFSTAYDRNGWEAGRLGYPTSDEFATPNGNGRKQEFQNGAIYGSLAGLAAVEGLIYDKYVSLGASDGMMGFPITDEQAGVDSIGRYSTFTGGRLYWHPNHGAHPVKGAVLAKWGVRGFEESGYGYPVGDPSIDEEGMEVQEFEHGTLIANPQDVIEEFSCLAAAERTAIETGIGDHYTFMCSTRGVSVQGPGGQQVFSVPRAEDITPQEAHQSGSPDQIGPQEDTGGGSNSGFFGIDCDKIGETSSSEPRKYDDSEVRKTITACFGERKETFPGEYNGPLWSRELNLAFSNRMIQRQRGKLQTRITDGQRPNDMVVSTNFELRRDVRGPDDSIDHYEFDTEFASSGATKEYDIPTSAGTYFIELKRIAISIPSDDFGQEINRVNINTGRFECEQYRYEGQTCTFPDNIDDHSGPGPF